MKILSLVYVGFAIAGLWGHLEVTLICIAMLALMRHAHKVFARQDEEYARARPPTQAPSEAVLEEHTCSFM